MNHSGQPAEAEAPSSHGLFYWPPFWFFIFLVLAVSAIGYVTFQQNKAETRQKEMEQLSTIADLKVEEITKWREERKGDAETLAQGPFFSREVEKWLQGGMPPGESRSMILERMESMHRAYGYREIFLFDADGKPVLATSPDAPPLGGPALEAVNEAIRTQSIIFMDIGSRDEARSMGLAAPVLVIHDGKPKTTGAIYLQIDPSRFLFPLLKAIPLTSKNMEIVLVRREGNDVLFLNVSAANAGADLLRQPLSQSKLPAAMAVSGNQTEADGIDYRGVPVFAALRKIPGTDWSLVAKVGQEEIYAPLQKMAWLVAGAIAILIALTGVAVGLWWRSQRARFLIAEQQQTEKNLRATSAYTRNLIEASLDPLVTISPEGKITDVNKATEEATGFSRSELIGTDFASYFTEPEMAQAGYRQVFNQGFVHDYPLTIRHQSGRLIDVLYNATVYRDEAGNIQGVFAAARDITERKQAEESVRISQARFSTIFNQAPLGIALIDSFTGQIHEVNPRFAEIAGRTIEEMMTIDWMSITHPDDVQKDLDNMALLNAGKIPGFSMDKRYLRPDGSFVWINMTIAPLRLEQNVSPRHLCMIEDITERKKADEYLRNSEHRLKEAQRIAHIGDWNLDLDGNVLTWSDEIYRLFELDPEKFNPSYEAFLEAIHPDDRERVNKAYTESVSSKVPYDIEHRLLMKDGRVKYVNERCETYYSEDGKPLRSFGTVHDITGRKLAEKELHEKEERLALATLDNGVGIWDWNLITQEMVWDDSMYALYRIRREDFPGTEEAWRVALHPDDLERGDREVNDAISGKKPFDTEFRVVWPNGEIHHIKAVANVFRDEQGTPLRMLGINMDITELRQTSIALQEKTNLLRNIIDSSADYIFAKDRELHTILCNEIFARAVGKHVQDLIGKTDIENGWDPLLVKGDTAKGIRGYEQDDLDAIAGKTIHSVDQLTVDGELHYVDTVKLPLRDDAGHTLGMFGISRDITESKFRESIQMARLRLTDYAANHTLKELLVATLDEACALTGSSIGFYHFLDADQKTLTLQAWSTRTTREFCKAEGEGSHYDIDAAGVWVDCVRERRPVIHNDYAALPNKRGMPPGHAHVEREMVVPIFRNELIVAILGVGNKAAPYKDNDLDSAIQLADLAWDIAVAKRAEEEILRLNAELEQRVVERTASLEAANKELESFAYSVSHDLRVPLRAIDGFSRLVLKQYEERLDDEGKRLLNVVRNNTKKMGQLIDDILAFSRAGRLEIKTSEVNMDTLARDVWQELEPSMAGRDVRLDIKPLPKVQGDPAMLRQVWVNLLGNAAKFTNSQTTARIEIGGSLELAANGAGNEYTFYVKDNGVGFDQQYVGKLFGVFQRLHGVDEFEGTGIGLAIVKRIITRHGGRVWAEGKVNEGATIYFALPN